MTAPLPPWRKRLPKPLRAQRVRGLRAWGRALRERNTPLRVGLAFATGTFVGAGPFFPVHGWVALFAATTLRLNRVFTFVGSRICVFFIFPWILWAEVNLAHALRTGTFATVDRAHILDNPRALLGDALLGWIPVGGPLAILSFSIGYVWATFRMRRRARRFATRESVPKLPIPEH